MHIFLMILLKDTLSDFNSELEQSQRADPYNDKQKL